MIKLTSTGVRYVYLSTRAVDPPTGADVDLTGASFKAALVRSNDRPDAADWKAATSAGTGLVAGQVHYFARVLVGAGQTIAPGPGRYTIWLQVTLGSEVAEDPCGEVIVS